MTVCGDEGGGGREGGIGGSKVWGLSSVAHELARLRRNKVRMQIIMLIINKSILYCSKALSIPR